ncbi:putative transmembrane protein [Cedratvirus kamchatka]|uniref:Transmembrane protein n=1 Tax=Cedratvirus kamchatka TaxID=2716914 RepID=A0A6G8MX53_9VIRU|nr:putative transmembrane protein [Cedratvirus kamchatka]
MLSSKVGLKNDWYQTCFLVKLVSRTIGTKLDPWFYLVLLVKLVMRTIGNFFALFHFANGEDDWHLMCLFLLW